MTAERRTILNIDFNLIGELVPEFEAEIRAAYEAVKAAQQRPEVNDFNIAHTGEMIALVAIMDKAEEAAMARA